MVGHALGIRFDETMKGGFATGVVDPNAGRERGDMDGTMLAMHASVEIVDLERFIDEPEHLGGLSGTIDYPPLGMGLASHSGKFNLFSPANEPETKYMIYELGFLHDGQDRYLAGRKVVRDDPGFDLWSDTTTLYTRLHAGIDTAGEVIGAGVLTLGVSELKDLLSTLRVTGALEAADKASAIAAFGSFFLGELWDSYAGFATK